MTAARLSIGRRVHASNQPAFYDPLVARFIQPDTVVPDGTNPQALNRYSYVYNNPLLYRDPTGHWPELDWLWDLILGQAAHGLIEAHIQSRHDGWFSERNVRGGKDSPRLDLLNPEMGTAFEIKTEAEGADAARRQLNRALAQWDSGSAPVCRGSGVDCPNVLAPHPDAGDGAYSGTLVENGMIIEYWQADDGVILYNQTGVRRGRWSDLFQLFAAGSAARAAANAAAIDAAAAGAAGGAVLLNPLLLVPFPSSIFDWFTGGNSDDDRFT